jgi:iron complex outermembrane receptor protein
MISHSGFSIRSSVSAVAALVGGLAFVQLAWSADATKAAADNKAADDAELEEIVVTGTQIRGVAPTGANVVSVSSKDIQAMGATSVTEVLANIPQISGGGTANNGFFNGIPQVSAGQIGASFGNNTNVPKPSLRQNPGGSDSGNSTLTLVNGMRTSGVGTVQNVANVDTVPAALLERVEVNLDGGSAIYGSDAMGGVINFVTKRKFDGAQVSARYGFASGSYRNWDGNVIVGKDWGRTSAFISYSHTGNKPLLNGERDYYRPIDFSTGLQLERACDIPNVQVAGTNPARYYAATDTGIAAAPFTLLGPTPTGSANVCTLLAQGYKASANRRDNVLGSFAWDISDTTKSTTRVRYASNWVEARNGVAVFNNQTIRSNNPYWRPLPAPDAAAATYGVHFNLGSVYPIDTRAAHNRFKQWGLQSELSKDIGSNWQFRALFDYDESRTDTDAPVLNTTAIANALQATTTTPCSVASAAWTANKNATTLAAAQAACLNPFNVAASNPALLASLGGFHYIAAGQDRIFNVKTIVDGTVFKMSGGDVKVAVGAEYLDDRSQRGFVSGPLANPIVMSSPASQSVWSLFGEVSIPLVSAENAKPLVKELRFSASGRYDRYSTVGGTTNPSIGGVYKPFSWLAIRGNYSESFRAPTTYDTLGQLKVNTTISQFTIAQLSANLQNPAVPTTGYANFLGLGGTSPDLKSQRGEAWSFGTEITPVKGLLISLSYYQTKYLDAFSTPIFLPLFPDFANLVILRPTQAQVDSFVAQAGQGQAGVTANASQIYGLYDIRTRNLPNSRVAGVDYSLSYTMPTGFGSMYGRISGTLNRLNKVQSATGLPFTNNLESLDGTWSGPRHKSNAQLGFTASGWRGQVSWSHIDGYPVTQTAAVLQSRVSTFDTFNAFVSYDFGGGNYFSKGLQASLTITNATNSAPPIYRTVTGVNAGTAGDTIGRVVQMGFTKTF